MRRGRVHRAGPALAIAVSLAVCGCGPSPITGVRIEASIARTFANLVHAQLSRVGLSPLAGSDINVVATCRRTVAAGGAAGAGDWVCTLAWYGPNRKILRDTYDLFVGTDGCYTATADGAEAQLGGPTIAASDGSNVRNLLYAFEGCFDTT